MESPRITSPTIIKFELRINNNPIARIFFWLMTEARRNCEISFANASSGADPSYWVERDVEQEAQGEIFVTTRSGDGEYRDAVTETDLTICKRILNYSRANLPVPIARSGLQAYDTPVPPSVFPREGSALESLP
jgi:hypothetical protein